MVKSLGPELTSLPQTSFKLTARFINSPPGNPYQVATFKSKHSYVGLGMLKAFSSIYVDFRFKTVEANGILLFNGGRKNDFFCVELVNGHINYIFDMGDGPVTIRDKSKIHMNDNRWHTSASICTCILTAFCGAFTATHNQRARHNCVFC